MGVKTITIDGNNPLCGREVNLDSPKQLQNLLYKDLKLPIISKTKEGNPSADKETLAELSGMHPIVNTLIEGKQAATVLRNRHQTR